MLCDTDINSHPMSADKETLLCKACLDLISGSKDDCLMTKCFLLHVVCCAAQPILRERESRHRELQHRNSMFPRAGQAHPTPLSEAQAPGCLIMKAPPYRERPGGPNILRLRYNRGPLLTTRRDIGDARRHPSLGVGC